MEGIIPHEGIKDLEYSLPAYKPLVKQNKICGTAVYRHWTSDSVGL